MSRSSTASSRSFDSRSAGVPWRPLVFKPLDPPLDQRQVGEDELEVEPLEVPRRVDRAVGMRVGRVLEGADDVEQRVGLAQPGEVLGRQLLGPDLALRRGRRRGQVDVRDVGLDDFFGLKISASRSSRSSGTLTTPTLSVMPPNPPVSAWPRVSVLKTVVLPEPASPTMAICTRHGRAGSSRRRVDDVEQRLAAAKRRRLSQKSSMLRSRTRPLDHDVCGVTMTFGRS